MSAVIVPVHLAPELAATSAALLAVVGSVRRELARRQSVLHSFPVESQALLLSALHTIDDLDRLAALLEDRV